MDSKAFRNGIFEKLLGCGFRRWGRLMRRDGDGAVVLVGVEKGFGNQLFISVGFVLTKLASEVSKTIEKSHLYFRCERLFPELRVTILQAGELSDSGQADAYRELLGHFENRICDELTALGTDKELLSAYEVGRLSSGLITKEARESLSSSKT